MCLSFPLTSMEYHDVLPNTPVTLIPNQQESSRTIRNEEFQNSRHIREGISNPVTLEAE